jgi:hypothetical protein
LKKQLDRRRAETSANASKHDELREFHERTLASVEADDPAAFCIAMGGRLPGALIYRCFCPELPFWGYLPGVAAVRVIDFVQANDRVQLMRLMLEFFGELPDELTIPCAIISRSREQIRTIWDRTSVAMRNLYLTSSLAVAAAVGDVEVIRWFEQWCSARDVARAVELLTDTGNYLALHALSSVVNLASNPRALRALTSLPLLGLDSSFGTLLSAHSDFVMEQLSIPRLWLLASAESTPAGFHTWRETIDKAPGPLVILVESRDREMICGAFVCRLDSVNEVIDDEDLRCAVFVLEHPSFARRVWKVQQAKAAVSRTEWSAFEFGSALSVSPLRVCWAADDSYVVTDFDAAALNKQGARTNRWELWRI